jgi:hypothetical protein
MGTSAGVSTTSIAKPSAEAMRCRRKFLRFFPGGFYDETYIDWERGYKWRPTNNGLKWLPARVCDAGAR